MMEMIRIRTANKPLPLVLCLLSCLLAPLPAQAQLDNLSYEQSVAVFGEQRIFEFRRFSLELTDESKNELLELVEIVQKFPAVLASNVIIIQTFTCEKELNVKPYIAACRGQVIIDFLVEELYIPRKKCFIQDGGPNYYDTECEVLSSVNVYLKPEW